MLQLEQVKSVYSGIDGKCCCGCSGKHYYASAHREAASKSRGYKVEDDEISDRMVKKVVGLINRAVAVDNGSNNVSTVVGNRLYIAYHS